MQGLVPGQREDQVLIGEAALLSNGLVQQPGHRAGIDE